MFLKSSAFLAAAAFCFAQHSRAIYTGYLTTPKYRIDYRCVLEPAGETPQFKFRSGTYADSGNVHRYMGDDVRKIYTGYDIGVEPGSNGGLRVTLMPLTISLAKLSLPDNGSGWSMAPLPKFPPAQEIQQGDTIALDVMVNPATGQRIVDYITITGVADQRPTAKGTARDFRPEDGIIRLVKPNVTVGHKVVIPRGNGEISGNAVWIAMPDKGRYILSLVPNEKLGFRKAGEIRDTKLSFQWDGDLVECETTEPIVSGSSAVWNLYVYHDGPSKETLYAIGAASGVDWLIKRTDHRD